MPKITSVNSRFGRNIKRDNIFQQLWDWFFSLDTFWRSVFIVMLCIIVATPLITSSYLTFFNHASSSVTNFYVTPSGNDSYDGSLNYPWQTISHAASVVATFPSGAAVTVHVAPGTYTDPIISNASGAVYSPLTYVSDMKWGAKIVTSGVDSVWVNNGNNVIIDGFDVTGTDTSTQQSNFVRLGIVNYGSNVIIRNNRVHDIAAKGCTVNGGAGIDDANYFASNDQVESNLVFNIGSNSCAYVHGIYHANSYGLVTNNISYGNSGSGIQLWHADANTTVTNNLLFYNYNNGLNIGAGDAPYYGTVSANFNVVNNNIIVDNTGYGIKPAGSLGVNNIYSNNIFYNNSVGNFYHYANQTDVNSITTVPPSQLFVNYQLIGGGDYHLVAGSKAIDAGIAQGAPSDDFDGIPRYQGKAYDIGPYEWYDPTVYFPTPTPTPDPWWNITPAPTQSPTQTVTSAPTSGPTSPPVYVSPPVVYVPSPAAAPRVTWQPVQRYQPNPNEYTRPSVNNPDVVYPTLAVEPQSAVQSNKSIYQEALSFVLSINNSISGSIKQLFFSFFHINIKY